MFRSLNELWGDLEAGLTRNMFLVWLLTAREELTAMPDLRRPEGLVMLDSFSESLSLSTAGSGLRDGAEPGLLCQYDGVNDVPASSTAAFSLYIYIQVHSAEKVG